MQCVALYKIYPIVARAWHSTMAATAFEPSARSSKSILHAMCCGHLVFFVVKYFIILRFFLARVCNRILHAINWKLKYLFDGELIK